VGFAILGIAPFLVAAEPAEFHVATTGKDENPGTTARPFATLERARDAIRESGLAGKTTCTVWLHGGIHRRKQTFALDEQDSGTRGHSIIYSSAKGETARLIGGTVLKADAFSLVDDPALLDRLPEPARGKVYMLDIEAQGIRHAAAYPDKFTDNGGIFALVSNDMGAVYSFSKPGGIVGDNTFRYNFVHSSPEGDGVYYDHVANHSRVYGNVAYRLGPTDPAIKAKRGCGFLIKNGTNNRVDIFNNIAVDCKTGYYINAGEGSVVRDNVAIACGNNHGAADLKEYQTDPGFVDRDAMDLGLRDDAGIYSDDEGFPEIPFAKIGLYADKFRTTVPGSRG
jgi:hypothetical protein